MDPLSDSDLDFELEGPFETVGSEPGDAPMADRPSNTTGAGRAPARDVPPPGRSRGGNAHPGAANASSSSAVPPRPAGSAFPLGNPPATAGTRSGAFHGRTASPGPQAHASRHETRPATTSPQLQQELYQKIGENAILRSRLDSIEKEHQKAINDLISQQNQVRADQRLELEAVKRRLQKERTQHEFLAKEMRAREIVGAPFTPASHSPSPGGSAAGGAASGAGGGMAAGSGAASTGTGAPRRKPEPDPFSDGFVVKKPRLAPGSMAPAGPGAGSAGGAGSINAGRTNSGNGAVGSSNFGNSSDFGSGTTFGSGTKYGGVAHGSGSSHVSSSAGVTLSGNTHSSNTHSGNTHNNAHINTPIGTPSGAPVSGHSSTTSRKNDHPLLLPFLVTHKAPGFADPSLQILYRVSTHVPGLSMGRDLAVSPTRDELLLKILSHIEVRAAEFSADISTLLLAVLHDLLFVKTQLQPATTEAAPRMLSEILMGWLQQLRPLPSLDAVGKLGLLRIADARRFVCILYGLDALLAMDWPFALSVELCRTAFAHRFSPQIYARVCELIARHPTPTTAALLVLHVPRAVVQDTAARQPRLLPNAAVPGGAPATTEMLFGGMGEPESHTAEEFVRRVPEGSTYCRLVARVPDFAPLLQFALRKSQQLVVVAQCAWIGAAQANVELGPVSESGPEPIASSQTAAPASSNAALDRGVLSLLSVALEATFFAQSPVVQLATAYFWCRDVDDLRETMAAPDLTELCVCLTKIVHANDNERNIVGQAQDILRDFTSIEEVEHLYDAFRPRDQWNEGDYTVEEDDYSADEGDQMVA